MKRVKDKEFDDLFKDQLKEAEFDPGYLEDDWDKLELMLDKPQKRRGIVFLLPILSTAAAILIFLGWWMFRPEVSPVVKPKQNMVAGNLTHQSAGIITKPQQAAGERQAAQPERTAQAASQIKTAASLVADNRPKAGSSNSLLSSGMTNSVVGSAPSNQNIADSKNPASSYIAQFTGNRNHNDLFTANAMLALNEGNKNAVAANVEAKPMVQKPYVLPTEADNKKDDAKAGSRVFAKHPQLALTVLGAPEVNGVGSFADAKAGSNVGLLFSAGIFNKLTISTGATYATMPYNTSMANYHTAYTFKTSPSQIEADCRALDIPVNVDYQLYHKGLNKFSVGTGLSSYVMLHESYDYYYNDPAAKGPSDYTVPNHGKYFFGIANVQATYTRQVNSKFGVSIQPYLKLPLTNIGYSQAKLQTAGVAVGLSWNINALTKP